MILVAPYSTWVIMTKPVDQLPVSAPVHDVFAIESATDRGWPSQVSRSLGRWLLRWSPTKENRPRSTVAWPEQSHSVDALVEQVEAFYREREDHSRFQIIPKWTCSELTSYLVEQDYVATDSSLVMIAPGPLAKASPDSDRRIICNLDTDASAWIDRWVALAGDGGASADQLEVVQSLEDRAAFVSVYKDDALVGLGRGTLSGRLLGLFNIYTVPPQRRSGIGTAVVSALAEWGGANGIEQAYLQVETRNVAAQRLYNTLGFGTAYRYYYLIHPSIMAEIEGGGGL